MADALDGRPRILVSSAKYEQVVEAAHVVDALAKMRGLSEEDPSRTFDIDVPGMRGTMVASEVLAFVNSHQDQCPESVA